MRIGNFIAAASALLIGALALGGCGRDLQPAADSPAGQRIAVEARAGSVGNTRTELNDRRTEWVAGDRIGIFSPQNGAKNLLLRAIDSGASSAFDGDLVWRDASQDFYAYYPHTAGTFAHTAVPVSLPDNQTQSEGGDAGHLSALDLMVAGPLTDVPMGEDVRLQFSHVFTLLELRVIGTGSVSRVAISAATGNRLAFGGGTMDVSQEKPADGEPYSLVRPGASSPSVALSLTAPATLTDDETTTPALYMMVNPADLTGQQITVSATIDGVPETIVADGFRLDRGRKYTLVIDLRPDETDPGAIDGKVTKLQAATEGTGIDIVLMGDGFTKSAFTGSSYDRTMRKAMESFFSEEPYKSHRRLFNVWMVNVVSESKKFDGVSTALGCSFGEGTVVKGNDQACMRYARKAISESRMDKAALIVIVNDTSWRGTCYMYYPNSGDWGNGLAVSYSTLCGSDRDARSLLHHEAAGHAFAKLGDEYWEDNGTISTAETSELQQLSSFGWWKNVDLTSDRSRVKWARFLADPRYASQGLGVYEGGFTWQRGVWRPTEYSIMRFNTGGFNAPSREAIWYRIHKLAHGAGWQYDYEEFVAWDLSHYSAARAAGTETRARTGAGTGANADVFAPVPHTPPVVIPHSWREALNVR